VKQCVDFTCGNAAPGIPYRIGLDCPKCWAALHHSAVAESLGRQHVAIRPANAPAGRMTIPVRSPCRWEGPVVEGCRTCGGDQESRHVRLCAHPDPSADRDKCTRGRVGRGVQSCQDCTPDYEPVGSVRPLKTTRISGLFARHDGRAFNGGIVRHRGKLVLFHRDGWAGSDIHAVELTEDYQPLHSTRLAGLWHIRAAAGREDPRPFVLRGQLHVAFTGVEWVGRQIHTNVLYARLTDDFAVEQVFAPELVGRQRPMEKNWAPFEWDGRLFFVYSVNPHRIIEVAGDQVVSDWISPNPLPWSGGEHRGGCAPIRTGDTFLHVTHGRVGAWEAGVYNVGAVEFEARPPFRVLRQTPDPSLRADPLTNSQARPPGEPAVAFPCGAVLEDGRLKVAMGVHDTWVDVVEWDAASVDHALATPPTLARSFASATASVPG